MDDLNSLAERIRHLELELKALKHPINKYEPTAFENKMIRLENEITSLKKVIKFNLGLDGLADPDADRILFWDDSEGSIKHLAPSTGLLINGTNITTKDSEIDHGSLAGLTDNDHPQYTRFTDFAWASWTPTYYGFSTPPESATARYCVINKICWVNYVCTSNGTSNANNFEISAPLEAAVRAISNIALYVDSGLITRGAGYAQIVNGGTKFLISNASGLTSWATTGDKRATFQIFYEV